MRNEIQNVIGLSNVRSLFPRKENIFLSINPREQASVQFEYSTALDLQPHNRMSFHKFICFNFGIKNFFFRQLCSSQPRPFPSAIDSGLTLWESIKYFQAETTADFVFSNENILYLPVQRN